jgi:lycopene cyclase domain-containing protein
VTYTALALACVVLALVLDRWVARTRVTSTRDWWFAYAIIVFFQLLTNGWLTGRGIVRYSGDAILGSGEIRFVGDGRLVFAPVEDLMFGFGLVLCSCVAWTWLGRRAAFRDADRDEAGNEVGV